jgi:DNA polymerase-3 subunit alpha
MHNAIPVVKPQHQRAPEFSKLALLNKERELVGMYLSSHPLDAYKFEIKHFVSHSLLDAAQHLKDASAQRKAAEQELCVAGIVTTVKKAVAKKSGKNYGTFVIEDFTGTLSFSLFGKDYENFMGYLEEGLALFIRCAPQPRYGENSEWELKIRSIALLSNIKDDFVKKVSLKLPVEMISTELRAELVAVLKEHTGRVSLNIKIVDKESGVAVDFLSRTHFIAMNPDFVAFLERKGIAYEL